MKGIADTGFIVAFGNRSDRHHAWAVEIAKRITEPLLTCAAVLAEAAFHLASPKNRGLRQPAEILKGRKIYE